MPDSVIDKLFLAAVVHAKIPYKAPTPELSCFSDDDFSRAEALRIKVSSENPQQCLTFERAGNAPRVEELLRERKIPAWREKSTPSITICHLLRDARKVNAVVEEVFPRIK